MAIDTPSRTRAIDIPSTWRPCSTHRRRSSRAQQMSGKFLQLLPRHPRRGAGARSAHDAHRVSRRHRRDGLDRGRGGPPVGAHVRRAGRVALAAIVRAMSDRGVSYSAVLVNETIRAPPRTGAHDTDAVSRRVRCSSKHGDVRDSAVLTLAATLKLLAHHGAS